MLVKSKKRLESFKNNSVKTINSIGGATEAGPCLTMNWGGWFDGSLFNGGGVNEFDKCTANKNRNY
jgi:hypothetical protein